MKKNIVISVAMTKGGSGRSSTVANLAFALSEMGQSVLIIDTDYKNNLTWLFDVSEDPDIPAEDRKNFYNAFMNKEDIRKHIIKTKYENIDFVMSDASLSIIESKMSSISFREFRAKDILKALIEDTENGYDFILIDQNSSIGIFNTSLFHASNEVLIPLEPSTWGLQNLVTLLKYINIIKTYNKKLRFQDVNILGILFNKIDKSENIYEDSRAAVESVFPNKTLKNYIPKDINIAYAQLRRMPLHTYKKNSSAVKYYRNLAEEIVEIVKERYQ